MSGGEQRWRYERRTDGAIIWLPFRADFPCIYCERPVGALSLGGPAVCCACDCGINADGSKWTSDDLYRLMRNAKRRLDELPDDPAWADYEAALRARAALEQS